MGMDVSGRNAANEKGVYFRANVWSWRPIHALIHKLGSDLIDEHTLMCMGANDGAGPTSAEVCRQLADRFTVWLEHNTEGYSVDCGCHVLKQVNEHGMQTFATTEQVQDTATETETAHRVCDEHLQEFVEFLRHCGGFQVW